MNMCILSAEYICSCTLTSGDCVQTGQSFIKCLVILAFNCLSLVNLEYFLTIMCSVNTYHMAKKA